MTIRVAINGFGRIGRNILRALYESDKREQIEVVAINDLGDINVHAHLLKYDTVHGRFDGELEVDDQTLSVNGDAIRCLAIAEPDQLPWQKLNVDVVFECTGRFTKRSAALGHINAGARKVLISAPASDADATIVYGVNHRDLKAEHRIVSNASCTTNCLAPLAKTLHKHIGIETGLMTTIHSYTNDQKLVDVYH